MIRRGKSKSPLECGLQYNAPEMASLFGGEPLRAMDRQQLRPTGKRGRHAKNHVISGFTFWLRISYLGRDYWICGRRFHDARSGSP